MAQKEHATCKELIEPALAEAGWEWQEQLRIGPGRVNLTGETMYDETQAIIADYILRYRGVPLAILEAKAESHSAADGMQQASRYAARLGIRFSIASNGHEWIITDNETGDYQTQNSAPAPDDITKAMGVSVDWQQWEKAFNATWHLDQINQKKVRPYQEMAIMQTLWSFAQGIDRILLLMATGTGKTFTVFQLIWKLFQSDALTRGHVLFLTDRNSLKDQAYRAFSAFANDERVVIDKKTVSQNQHTVGKIFFANYQNLDEDFEGKKIYEHFDPDFFDLVIIDECHRSGFGDWFGVLEHFGQAKQLGLTATPRELENGTKVMTSEEKRRDTYEYFGEPAYTYSLKQAIEDGFLVPYLLEERITNVDADGFDGPDGKHYTRANYERDIRMPDRTTAIAEDLWDTLGKYDLRDEKSIVFCVDDTHAAFMAQELRRLSGDNDYAARITRSERNSHQLERNFAEVGRSTKPRIAVTVDLLTTGFDAPDAKNIVFVRPLRSAILYKQMKGRGTRLCEDIDKRYFTIFDYSGASHLEDAEFDGHPANRQKPKSKGKSKKTGKPAGSTPTTPKPIGSGVSVYISDTNRYVCLADGQKIPFEEYTAQSKEIILNLSTKSMDQLLQLWVDKKTRQQLREELREQDIYLAAFRHYFDLHKTDDVDIMSKIAFDLVKVPARTDRVIRLWDQDAQWLLDQLGEKNLSDEDRYRLKFWGTALDHYQLYGIDDLEQAKTYQAPQFVNQFGSFQTLSANYGGGKLLKTDLEAIKQHLYVPM